VGFLMAPKIQIVIAGLDPAIHGTAGLG